MVDELDLYRKRKEQKRIQNRIDTAFEVAGEGAEPQSEADLYIVRKRQKQQQDTAEAAARVQTAGNPDEHAADAKLAQEYQTLVNPEVTPPPSFVQQNRDRLGAAIQQHKTTTALTSSPMLTRWLNNEENAKLAADDVPALAQVEAGLGHAKNALKRGVVDRGGQVFSQMQADMMLYAASQNELTFAERYRRARGEHYGHGFFGNTELGVKTLEENRNPDGSYDIRTLDELGDDPVEAFVKTSFGTFTDFFDRVSGQTKRDNLDAAAEWQKTAAEFAQSAQETPVSETAQRALAAFESEEPLTLKEATARTVKLATEDPGALVAMVAEVGLESAGSLIPAAAVTITTRNPAAGVATAGGTSYAVERNLEPVQFFAEKGYDLTKPEDVQRMFANPELMKEATERGHTRGLIIGALDLVSGGVAGKALAKNPVADAALQSLVQGSLGGSGEGLAQYATDGEVDYGEVVIEALAEFSTAPIDVAAIGARKLGDRKAKAQEAAERAETVQGLGEASVESKLRERAPDKFRAFVESATEGSGLENMYFPAEEFLGYFQQQNIEPEQVAEVLPGVDIEQVRRAALTGEDISMPVSTYMERVAGSDMDQFVMDNAKFSPDQMTAAEARTFEDNAQLEEARVAAQQEAFEAAQAADQAAEETVYNDVVDQLVEAGRSRVAAQQEAQLYPAFYKTMAERMGVPVESLIETYRPPVVEGPQVKPLQGVKVDALTRDIAAMRERIRVRARGGKPGKATPENEYLDAVEQTVKEAGLDPNTATEEEIRAAVAPDTINLNQSAITETPEFENWFGDSQVVDDKGKPLVLYKGGVPSHKLKDPDKFTTKGFEKKPKATADDYEQITEINSPNGPWAGYFTTNEDVANKFNSRYSFLNNEHKTYNTIATYVKMENPLVIDAKGEYAREFMLDAEAIDREVPNSVKNVFGEGSEYDGLILLNTADEGDVYVPRNPEQIKSVDNSGNFDPDNPNIYAQEERGRIRLPKDGPARGQAVIELFKEADLSTFIHESGHFFLSVLQDAAKQEGAPAEIQNMVTTAQSWWKGNAKAVAKDGGVTETDVVRYIDAGTTGDAAKDAAVDVGMQEQWARAFETYLMEGKAPTTSLRAAFEQFRVWLLEVYRKVRGDLNVEINEDIRQVFDMLLATDEEIANANVDNSGDMLASTAAELGISEDDYAHLAKLHQEAQDQTAARTIQAAMAPIRRMRDKAFKARREEIKTEVSTEVNSRPVYRAIEWMGNKRWLGAEEQPKIPTGMRLNKEQLVERYGPGVLRTLPRGSFRVYTPDGMDIDEVAGWFGFSSGDELVQEMEQAPKREEVIANETDRRAMDELSREESTASAAQEATEAFHNDKRGDYIAAELRTLHRATGNGNASRTSTASYTRQIARRTIAGLRARDAVAANRYLAAERKAAEQAQEAFAGGDKVAAADFKRRQLFNHMMFVESRKVAEEVGKTERLARRLNSKSTRKNLAPDYLGAIDDVLEQYDFRKIGPGKEKNRERMLAYVEMMKASGRENEIAIPPHILENAKADPYMTLTVEHLRGVYTTLRNIESTARRAQKLIDAQNERDMDAVVNNLSDAFGANIKANPPSRVETPGERRRQSARQFMDLVLNADTLLREIDGFQDGDGAAYTHLKRGLDEATARLEVRRKEAAEAFQDLYSVYETKERNQMAVATYIPELNMSMAKWDLISMVLNMGNADNIQRLTDPKVRGSFTQDQLDAVVARMDKRDMGFVQSVWDYIDGFYDEIAAREKRVTGVAPQKVQAQELVTTHGTYKGGYYPLKYDPRLSDRVAEETTDEIMNNMRAGRFGKAQTRNGHTKERAQSSGRAVLLDIGVLHGHINTLLHDLELSEQVTNTWRILQDPRVKGLFLDSGKQVDHQALEMWVQDVASGQVNSSHALTRTARFLKSGFTVSKLAFNLSTVAVQITGVSQSMVVIGKKNFVKGASQYVANPRRASRDVLERSAFMAERETTFNKDIYDIMGDIKVGPKAGVYKRAMQNYIGPASFYLMQKVQFYAVDMPTWLGAYQKALKDTGNDEAASIQMADRAVARSQASGIFSDRSPIERGTLTPTVRQSEFVRMFTALGSYMFAKANVAYERTGKTDFRSPKEVLSYTIDMVLLFTVEVILYNAIKGALPGMGDSDEDDEGWAQFLAKETALSVMSTMPFVRDLSSPLQGYSGGGSYGSITETLVKPFLQASQGEVDKAFVKSLVNSGFMLLHLPSSQFNRFVDAGWRQLEGEDVAPIEYIMGKR